MLYWITGTDKLQRMKDILSSETERTSYKSYEKNGKEIRISFMLRKKPKNDDTSFKKHQIKSCILKWKDDCLLQEITWETVQRGQLACIVYNEIVTKSHDNVSNFYINSKCKPTPYTYLWCWILGIKSIDWSVASALRSFASLHCLPHTLSSLYVCPSISFAIQQYEC